MISSASIIGDASTHQSHAKTNSATIRPQMLPRLTEDDFCKGKYSHQDQRCYTGRILDVFLNDKIFYFVGAYKEFRLATMDYLYEHHRDDHAVTGAQRAACWNAVALKLGYRLVDMDEYQAHIQGFQRNLAVIRGQSIDPQNPAENTPISDP